MEQKSASCKRMGSNFRIGGTWKISSPMLAAKRGEKKVAVEAASMHEIQHINKSAPLANNNRFFNKIVHGIGGRSPNTL